MSWKEILEELHSLAVKVPNRNAAQEDILGTHFLSLKHTDDNWEELHAAVHAIFGWAGQDGLLTQNSSQADFLTIHGFLVSFAEHEATVSSNSCLGAMMPRMITARNLCFRAVSGLNSDPNSSTEILGTQTAVLAEQDCGSGSLLDAKLPVKIDAKSSIHTSRKRQRSKDQELLVDEETNEANTDDKRYVIVVLLLVIGQLKQRRYQTEPIKNE
ncbi:hypothetical protein PHLCEN_2v13324 [Hermanssonia centrifuga]|uniref:Uncharacterized protein n=1 Tax=Hermanssonia centrifuga TaxID=98765 RepID=A0A2R6NFM5_9APHY|nr:hypothetical protein PHLCEN_2v13324 [Hermanssonia centrifuga]